MKLIATYINLCSRCGQRHEHRMRVNARSTREVWQKLKVRHGIAALLTGTRPASMRLASTSRATK